MDTDTTTASASLGPDEVLERISGAAKRRNKDLLLYVHVPFCTSKCHFCDWVTRYPTAELTSKGELQHAYVKAMTAQLEWYGPRLEELGYRVTNIYWGGGTPTRLEPDALNGINEAIHRAFDLSALREYSVECSPETLDTEKLRVLKRHGLTRISVGVQSFDEDVLRRMGRAHGTNHVYAALDLMDKGGINNFNIDLIVGFAGSTLKASLTSVDKALALGIPHVAVYPFRSNPDLVSTRQIVKGSRTFDWEGDWYETLTAVENKFRDAGYEHYAMYSRARGRNFYFDGQLHYYTQRADYLGVGLGARSFLGGHLLLQSQADRGIRDYLDDSLRMQVVHSARELVVSDLARQAAVEALSTQTGISYELWLDQFGLQPNEVRQSPNVAWLCARLEELGGRIQEDERGVRLEPSTLVDAYNRLCAREQADVHRELRARIQA